MKKRKLIIILLAAVLVLTASYQIVKHNAIAKLYVELCCSRLNRYVCETMGNCGDGEQLRYGPWKVTYRETKHMMEFRTWSWGVGSEAVHRGFYYSPHDLPLDYQGRDISFVQEEQGWSWKNTSGDGWEYTERITDNWFWYETNYN